MRKIHIDIETYCELDLKKVGVYRYVEHPSFEILCICWQIDGRAPQAWRCYDRSDMDGQIAWGRATYDADVALAFNAQFERVCLTAKGYLPVKFLGPDNWECVMVQALENGLPGKLEVCSQVLGLGGKDKEGQAAMLKLCKPRKPTKKDPATRYTPAAYPGLYDVLVRYCHKDVADERAVYEATVPISGPERLGWRLDQRINERGVYVDRELVAAANRISTKRKHQIDQVCLERYGFKPTQVKEIADYLGIEKANAESLKEYNPCSVHERELIEYRQERAKTSVSKFISMAAAVNSDGRLRGMFQYYGAGTTGRWAGRIVQLQNLIREGHTDLKGAISDLLSENLQRITMLHGSVMVFLSKLIRPALIPAPGNLFITCDYSAIEARVLGWLADCILYMNEYRGEGKLYEAMAAEVFGIPKDKIGGESRERFIGKTVILGCGYQMGLPRFIAEARKQGSTESEEVLKRAWLTYRKSCSEIVEFWQTMGDAAVAAVRKKGSTMSVAGGRITFKFESNWLYMTLPSGRRLAYYKPRVEWDDDYDSYKLVYQGIDSYTGQWVELKTYGGKLTENAVQAISRDLMLNAMYLIDGAGVKIAAHIHDEVVAEEDAEYAAEAKATIEQQMRLAPRWAAGLPLDAKAKILARYSK